MQTGLQNMERADRTSHLGQREQKDDLEGEDPKKLGSWNASIRRGDLSCQDAGGWRYPRAWTDSESY